MLKHISTTWALVQNIWSFDATDIWWNLIFGEIWPLGSAFGIWWHFLFDGICCFTALYILRYCIFDGLSYIWTYLVHICNTPNSLGCNSQASICCSNFQSCLKQSISDSILPVAGPNIPISCFAIIGYFFCFSFCCCWGPILSVGGAQYPDIGLP